MKEHYFDDLKVGDRFKSEPLPVMEKQVIEFAHKFDPQMFHLDRKSAERTIFKGLIASGWHTAAMTMRLFVRTLNFTEGAIGLGVDELRWPNTVRPGDVLTVETEIVSANCLKNCPVMPLMNAHGTNTALSTKPTAMTGPDKVRRVSIDASARSALADSATSAPWPSTIVCAIRACPALTVTAASSRGTARRPPSSTVATMSPMRGASTACT